MTSRPRTTSFVDSQKSNNTNFAGMKISSKDGSKVMTVIASPGQGPDRSTEVSYTDTKVCRVGHSHPPRHARISVMNKISQPATDIIHGSIQSSNLHDIFATVLLRDLMQVVEGCKYLLWIFYQF